MSLFRTVTVVSTLLAVSYAVSIRANDPIPYDTLAQHIVRALQVTPGERVLLRYDAATLGPLEPVVKAQLEAKGAVVESLAYGPALDFQNRLDGTDIYIWLPAGASAATPADQRAVLAKWLDDGKGRQIHFHWNGGTVDADGRAGTHGPSFDQVYVDALDINYARLSAAQDRVIAKLRTGEVRVTSPRGTDIRFRVGDRPFNKQDGNAAKSRTDQAKTRVDREIELPAGVLRVAPIESTANGVVAVPQARLLETATASDIRLEFVDGKVVKATAGSGQAALDAYLASSAALTSFREFGLGFNPKLVQPSGSPFLPYYGYGDAVVRLSLGDNTELAGAVRGGGSRWLFFPNTTVTVGGEKVVENGRLVNPYRY
jgi:hypothetical protein